MQLNCKFFPVLATIVPFLLAACSPADFIQTDLAGETGQAARSLTPSRSAVWQGELRCGQGTQFINDYTFTLLADPRQSPNSPRSFEGSGGLVFPARLSTAAGGNNWSYNGDIRIAGDALQFYPMREAQNSFPPPPILQRSQLFPSGRVEVPFEISFLRCTGGTLQPSPSRAMNELLGSVFGSLAGDAESVTGDPNLEPCLRSLRQPFVWGGERDIWAEPATYGARYVYMDLCDNGRQFFAITSPESNRETIQAVSGREYSRRNVLPVPFANACRLTDVKVFDGIRVPCTPMGYRYTDEISECLGVDYSRNGVIRQFQALDTFKCLGPLLAFPRTAFVRN